MDTKQLLIDLHIEGDRQGPGSQQATEMAIDFAIADRTAPLEIADIGCGTGASAILLAQLLNNANITAVDFLPQFLDVLRNNADRLGVGKRITTLACPMQSLPFENEQWDVIWSEGAIYNMGFENGIQQWRRLLKVGGVLVVSEITWMTADRPAEIQAYWDTHYPEMGTASYKIKLLEDNGYTPVAYFVLGEECWLENYYLPLQNRFEQFLAKHHHSSEAVNLVVAEEQEIRLFQQFRQYFSYGVYIARRTC
jgi:ubiquinone/menaquinone biosynthesis C-methylase UbiE